MASRFYLDFGVDSTSDSLPTTQGTTIARSTMAPVPNSDLQPNGASPPMGGTTGATEGKKHLRLTHLPARKDIRAPFPRTPGSVRANLCYVEAYIETCCDIQVDPNNPPWPAFRGYHTYSFANATMGHRLPTILGKAIDDVIVTLNEQSFEDRILDLVECIERMEELKRELERSAKLRPIIDDGEADVALWNKEIAKYFLGVI